MNKHILVFLGAFAIVGCGGSNPAPADPTGQTTTTATPGTPATPTTPATPDAPSTTSATPSTPATPSTASTPSTPAAPTTPTTAAAPTDPCPAAKEATGKDLASCKADCKKLDDKAPAGSKCVPPRTACLSSCDTKFKK